MKNSNREILPTGEEVLFEFGSAVLGVSLAVPERWKTLAEEGKPIGYLLREPVFLSQAEGDDSPEWMIGNLGSGAVSLGDEFPGEKHLDKILGWLCDRAKQETELSNRLLFRLRQYHEAGFSPDHRWKIPTPVAPSHWE